jgi:ribosomal-protein-serine acetyltransferase
MFARTVAPGIELRLFDRKDADDLFAVIEAERSYLREWLPWVDVSRSADDVRHFIERVQNQFASNQGPQSALWVYGCISGAVGVHPIDWPNRHCSIGYWLESGLQGRGIMTRACASILDYLFDELGLHRVTIQCGTGNHKSCSIPQRLGFVREGVIRQAEWVNDRWLDMVVWGMLEDEWRARREKPVANFKT